LNDLRIIATLGVGGFGRVELVQIAGDVKKRSFALKQMKKAQVRITKSFGSQHLVVANLKAEKLEFEAQEIVATHMLRNR
jgi:hypothetical protein